MDTSDSREFFYLKYSIIIWAPPFFYPTLRHWLHWSQLVTMVSAVYMTVLFFTESNNDMAEIK